MRPWPNPENGRGENAWIRAVAFSGLSSATQNRNLAGQRGHLRAHSLDVRLVVQALRIVGHAVAQLEQTVGKALKDCIAFARCSHGLHQVRCGEEGTPVSSTEIPPCSPTAHSLLGAASPHRAVSVYQSPASGRAIIKGERKIGPRMAGLHPTTCPCRLSVSGCRRAGLVSSFLSRSCLQKLYLLLFPLPPFLTSLFSFISLFLLSLHPSFPNTSPASLGEGFCSAIFFFLK